MPEHIAIQYALIEACELAARTADPQGGLAAASAAVAAAITPLWSRVTPGTAGLVMEMYGHQGGTVVKGTEGDYKARIAELYAQWRAAGGPPPPTPGTVPPPGTCDPGTLNAMAQLAALAYSTWTNIRPSSPR